MTKNINKINEGDQADGRPLEEYVLDELEVFPNEVGYRDVEFGERASEDTVKELGKLVMALSRTK